MIISASLDDDYLMRPTYGELAQFRELFGSKVVATNDGFTPTIYQEVPQLLIKDQEYFGSLAKSTKSYDTKSQSLRALGLTISISQNEILPATEGLYKPNFKLITANKKGYTMSGLPLVNMLAPNQSDVERIIIGFYGTYIFNTGLFYGAIDFANLGDIWSE